MRSVIRYVRKLEDKGYVRVERAARGSKIPNVYHLAGEAARIVLGRSAEEQVSEGQPIYKEQVPVSHSSAQADSSQAAEECLSDSRLSDSQAPVSAGRVTHRQITKEEEQKEKEQQEEEPTNRTVVVEDNPISPFYFKLEGMELAQMQALVDKYGAARVREALNAVRRGKGVHNQVGWMVKALQNNWQFEAGRKGNRMDNTVEDFKRMVAKYPGLINS